MADFWGIYAHLRTFPDASSADSVSANFSTCSPMPPKTSGNRRFLLRPFAHARCGWSETDRVHLSPPLLLPADRK